MPAADPCRRVLTPTEEAALFAPDALRAARHVMSGIPADEADEAYLAVFAILAAAAFWPEGAIREARNSDPRRSCD